MIKIGPPEQQWYFHHMYQYNLITVFTISLILIREAAFLLSPITIFSHSYKLQFKLCWLALTRIVLLLMTWSTKIPSCVLNSLQKNTVSQNHTFSFPSHSLYFRFEALSYLLRSTKQSLCAWFALAKSMVLQSEIKQLTVYIIHSLECKHAGVNGMKYWRSRIQGSITKPKQQVFLPRGAERVSN